MGTATRDTVGRSTCVAIFEATVLYDSRRGGEMGTAKLVMRSAASSSSLLSFSLLPFVCIGILASRADEEEEEVEGKEEEEAVSEDDEQERKE